MPFDQQGSSAAPLEWLALMQGWPHNAAPWLALGASLPGRALNASQFTCRAQEQRQTEQNRRDRPHVCGGHWSCWGARSRKVKALLWGDDRMQ